MSEQTDYDQDEFERELSELKLEAQSGLAEITDVEPKRINRYNADVGLYVTLKTTTGDTLHDLLPMPGEYHPDRSDLATLIEFTGSNADDIDSLVGKRVPASERSVDYQRMRSVLKAQAQSAQDWDYEKRLEKLEVVQ